MLLFDVDLFLLVFTWNHPSMKKATLTFLMSYVSLSLCLMFLYYFIKHETRWIRGVLELTRDKLGQTRDSQWQARDSQGQNRDTKDKLHNCSNTQLFIELGQPCCSLKWSYLPNKVIQIVRMCIFCRVKAVWNFDILNLMFSDVTFHPETDSTNMTYTS